VQQWIYSLQIDMAVERTSPVAGMNYYRSRFSPVYVGLQRP
jgi:hypothetical protein